MKSLFSIIFLLATGLSMLNANSRECSTRPSDTIAAMSSVQREITIITPTTEIYDGGTTQISYTGYDIYDLNDILLIKVAPSAQVPVKLKMAPGTYIIKPKVSNSSVFQITVGNGHPVEYVIPREQNQN